MSLSVATLLNHSKHWPIRHSCHKAKIVATYSYRSHERRSKKAAKTKQVWVQVFQAAKVTLL